MKPKRKHTTDSKIQLPQIKEGMDLIKLINGIQIFGIKSNFKVK